MVQKFSELPQRKVYIGNTPWETGQGVRLCLKFVLWNAGKFAKKPPVGCWWSWLGSCPWGWGQSPMSVTGKVNISGCLSCYWLPGNTKSKRKLAHQNQEEKPLLSVVSQKSPPMTNHNTVLAGKGEIFTESSLNITKNSKDGRSGAVVQ